MKFSHNKYVDPATGRIYLERWNFDFFGLFSIKLHKFHDSGITPYPHDHPWDFISIILSGGYVEERHFEDGTTETIRHKPGRIVVRKARDRHRVLEVFKPNWSLVFCSPRKRHWGYWIDGKWCWWPAYFWPDEIGEMAAMAKQKNDAAIMGLAHGRVKFPKNLPYFQD